MKTELLKIPFSEYCAIDAINSSKLKEFFADPKLFFKTHIAKTVKPEEEERYFIVGRSIHCLTLEPEQFDNFFMVGERRRSTKIGLANHVLADQKGLSLIDENEYKLCISVAAELPLQYEWCRHHQGAINVYYEIVIIVTLANGEKIKVMIDLCLEHSDIVYIKDVKSSSKESASDFDDALTEYDYLIQNAVYKFAVEAHFKKPCIFIFVFCGKKEPFNIAFLRIPDHQQTIGHDLFTCLLSRYVQAKITGIWYPEQVQEREAVIPKYAMQKYQTYINETQLI